MVSKSGLVRGARKRETRKYILVSFQMFNQGERIGALNYLLIACRKTRTTSRALRTGGGSNELRWVNVVQMQMVV